MVTWDELTAGGGVEGSATLPSTFATFQSAEITSVACSRSPSKKLSIFFSTPVQIASVVSPTQRHASWSTYRLLISACLHFGVSRQ